MPFGAFWFCLSIPATGGREKRKVKAMVTQNTFGVSFFIKKDKESNGTAPLFARITVNSLSTQLSLKRRVAISAWHQKEQRLDGNEQEDVDTREKMRQVRNGLNSAYDDLVYRYKAATAEEVKAKYEGGDEEAHTLLWLINYHETEIGPTLEEGTMKNYRSTKKFVKEFLQKKMKREDISLARLTPRFIAEFDLYLRLKKPEKGQKKCSHNTVMKHMERLRKIMSVALKNRWMPANPYEGYEYYIIPKDRHCLVANELERFRNIRAERPSQAIVRDMFVFSCYTGLAYAEITALTRADIKKDKDGEWWITMVRKKTVKSTERKFHILMLPEAVEVMEKYWNHPAALNNGTVFPRYTNQTMNRILKILAKAAKITKKVTYHLARHTFATTVTLENGVPIETVSHMLGHGSIRTTQIYAKVKV